MTKQLEPKQHSQRRGRHSPKESQEFILRKALSFIAKNGWEEFSIRKLANACKMSPSNVIYHFPNTEKLMLGLLDVIAQNNYSIVEAAAHSAITPFDHLVNYIEANAFWAAEFPQEAQIVLLIYSRAVFDKDFLNVFERMMERAQARVNDLVLDGINEGYFTLKPEQSTEVAQNIHRFSIGTSIFRMVGGSSAFTVSADANRRFLATAVGLRPLA